MRTRRTDRSIRRLLTLSTLLVHLAALAVTLFLNYFILMGISKKQALQDGTNNLAYMEFQLNNTISNLRDIQRLLFQDQEVRAYLEAAELPAPEEALLKISASQTLAKIVQTYLYLDSVTLFRWDGRIMSVGRNRVAQNDRPEERLKIQESEPFRTILSSPGLVWGGTYSSSDMTPTEYAYPSAAEVEAMLIPMVNIWEPGKSSVVSINILKSHFDLLYNEDVSGGSNVYLFESGGRKLLELRAAEQAAHTFTPSGLDELLERAVKGGAVSGSFMEGDGWERYQVIYRCHPETGWILVEEIPYTVFLRKMTPLQIATGTTFTLSIILVVFISYLISRRVIRSLEVCTARITDIGKGDLSQRLPAMGFAELNALASRFNHMIARLQRLMRENQDYEREKRLLEIEALQSQINPHFIYNSLTTIRWMATMARADNVSHAISALNNILRPIFAQTGIFWELKNELNFVQNYIEIMNYRYGGEIAYACTVPAQMLNMPVMRLLLQPAVENSILHGLRGSARAVIRIGAEAADDSLTLTVEDNGRGMEPDKIAALNAALSQTARPVSDQPGHGFGLYNINRRIKLQYGPSFGLSVRAAPSGGTIVQIQIAKIAADETPEG